MDFLVCDLVTTVNRLTVFFKGVTNHCTGLLDWTGIFTHSKVVFGTVFGFFHSLRLFLQHILSF